MVIVVVLAAGISFSVATPSILNALAGAGVPQAMHHPEWCAWKLDGGPTFTPDCVQASVPASKTIFDYCGDLDTLLGEGQYTKNQCFFDKAVSAGNAEACATIVDYPTSPTGYARCIATYATSSEHAAYCAREQQSQNVEAMVMADCITADNVNLSDTDGNTALFFAQTRTQQEAFIELGAEVNARNDKYDTPLMSLLENGLALDMVDGLLMHGALVNTSDYLGRTPLMLAADYRSNLEILKTLLEHGADIHYKSSRNMDVCQMMSGGEPDKNDQTRYLSALCGVTVTP